MHVPYPVGGLGRQSVALGKLLIAVCHVEQAPVDVVGEAGKAVFQPVGVVVFTDAEKRRGQ